MAIAFFGITRSLSYTYHSIVRNVLQACPGDSRPKVFCHFFEQTEIDNVRSGEFGRLNVREYAYLRPDWLELEPPELCLSRWGFENLKSYGDFWRDDFASLRNVVHQLSSLESVSNAILEDGFETCVFARPDLMYHDSLATDILAVVERASPIVRVPSWQPWNGYNDRFAICGSAEAIRAYGRRITLAEEFCQTSGTAFHSEKLLKYSLERASMPVEFMDVRASRIRADGRARDENFWPRPTPGRAERWMGRFRRALGYD